MEESITCICGCDEFYVLMSGKVQCRKCNTLYIVDGKNSKYSKYDGIKYSKLEGIDFFTKCKKEKWVTAEPL